MYMVCISKAMGKDIPRQVKKHLLSPVHNSIDASGFPFKKDKKNYFITLARFTPYKGQHIAVKLARRLRKRLRMSGVVAGIGTNRKLLFELSNPLSKFRNNVEFKYYSDKILPYVLKYPSITYAGNLGGAKKKKFIADAKALLFPIEWEEPFGMAVIEALACGTPVIAMRRGAMPEIIEHGVNGFLADNEEEFAEYMQRINEIDPAACRKSVEKRFAAQNMAENYIQRYNEVIARTKAK
jgi:glycosyltransferase involved in cell wall biosynthesis